MHTWPAPQAAPQAPQLLPSLWRSRQVPAQFTWPGGQLTAQRPPAQTCPAGQALPQAPQLSESTRGSTQPASIPAPQRMSGAAQETAQAPIEQTLPAGQTRPHIPQ